MDSNTLSQKDIERLLSGVDEIIEPKKEKKTFIPKSRRIWERDGLGIIAKDKDTGQVYVKYSTGIWKLITNLKKERDER